MITIMRSNELCVQNDRCHCVGMHCSAEIFKMAICRHLGFDLTGSSAVRSATLKNPTLEPNTNWIG